MTDFRDLIEAEERLLCPTGDRVNVARSVIGNGSVDAAVAGSGSADEPWVAFHRDDRVGLAFSGGGIRSATFNLGVLQGLQRLRMLGQFHYLATVSGGGYIGAWWSVWLSRRPSGTGSFPGYTAAQRRETEAVTNTAQTREPEEVRHLREFSNFLAPRMGFFQTETWAAVLAVISAIIPALSVAGAVLTAGLLLWLLAAALLTFPYAPGGAIGAAMLAGVAIFIIQWKTERQWCANRKAETCDFPVEWWSGLAIGGIFVTLGAWFGIHCTGWFDSASYPIAEGLRHQPFGAAWQGSVWSAFGIAPGKSGVGFDTAGFRFDPRILHATLAWFVAGFAMLLPRIAVLRWFGEDPKWRVRLGAADRILQRLLAAGVVWIVATAVWLAGAWLHRTDWGTSAAAGALASGGAFALLRNWIATQLISSKKSGMFERFKPVLPLVLAYLALVCAAIAVAAGIAAGLSWWGWWFWIGASLACLLVLLLAGYFFDPALISMHAFYRDRLARAYLGASNRDSIDDPTKPADAAQNRYVDLRKNDDRKLRELLPAGGPLNGPLHLVCCAANDLGGDTLSTLARGARSAVLSPLGFSIGDAWRQWSATEPKNDVSVASAITASAAAFNSNMGSVSMSLGPAVAFLMSALNLRLGLWLRHPLCSGDLGSFPGFLFLCEMFGITHAALKPRANGGAREPVSSYVHLSDGAHFENLALYELIRRHCRYILVSDCGADPDVIFDDLGNAMRRVREDFGVEIDIDLAPLKPEPLTGLSRQHLVVGTIYYDRARTDIGILVYIKPTLTGDETCDITQYRSRNRHFPHEATGDQFYDEAQWESYRRLGEHAIQAGLRVIQRMGGGRGHAAADLFAAVRREWYPAPADLPDRVANALERVAAIEGRVREDAAKGFARELFPELRELEKALGPGAKSPQPPLQEEGEEAPPEFEHNLPVVLTLFRAMEDMWLTCHLETHWTHPLNTGLVNLFQRWAYAPSCRLWWPLIRALHSSGFRRFVQERLALDDDDFPPTAYFVRGPFDEMPHGLARVHWKRSRNPSATDNRPGERWYYEFLLEGASQSDEAPRPKPFNVQVGLAVIHFDGEVARWTADDLFVPPSLWGAGLGRRFVAELLRELPAQIRMCEVELSRDSEQRTEASARERRNDPGARQEQNDLRVFYKSAGFRLTAQTDVLTHSRQREAAPHTQDPASEP